VVISILDTEPKGIADISPREVKTELTVRPLSLISVAFRSAPLIRRNFRGPDSTISISGSRSGSSSIDANSLPLNSTTVRFPRRVTRKGGLLSDDTTWPSTCSGAGGSSMVIEAVEYEFTESSTGLDAVYPILDAFR
jgi:hypothetical protein